ncbi:glutamyl-tRNA synthetase [Chthoniobacter flavus Ellin428]|uniref:Glutamate--tRNA ligase n=1 Tax=Chthoniobacter flavus Ellin428 TaxID=497964 RepID=B4CYQ9_9BACT|nr:glutamate--tRNA ligase family protein [Chthoniobacter flavus]EDY20600.1 glutamyl-tRNA synthetase [Chthoniobacter flavus Ellin428]TCO89893.1 glutamyl-tRNA synthetase [Chthoniobacter flavus]
MSAPVRVRFAPSPTGYLHVGGARTALFNWLYARHQGGKFILRIEDTDKQRNTAEAVQVIYDGLRWLGLDWDEGPQAGGDHGPYFQSEREAIYEKYFQRLKEAGHLYEDGGAWRFRFRREVVEVDDLICGKVAVDFANTEITPDMTIRRPDGSWIFHFVNVVDDIEMQMTHVIRGEDHLSNTPKHIQLFQALGVEPPRYGHIPLILNHDGSKMSKRDQGASITSYIEGGYAPEAVRNYFCLLGWSPKDDREIMPTEEIISRFDLANVNRKGAHFDIAKCDWFNAQYIQQMPMDRYRELAQPWLAKAGIHAPAEQLDPVLALEKMKVVHFKEIPDRVSFFFNEDYEYDPAAVEKTLRKPGAPDRLAQIAEAYSALETFDAATLEAKLKELASSLGVKPAEFIHPTRIAVSGRSVGPSLYHMLEVLGKARVLARIQQTRERFAA